MKIVKIGVTVKNNAGEVQLIMPGKFPDNCMAIFIDKDDYEEAKKRLEEE
jgi:hypothetical protein